MAPLFLAGPKEDSGHQNSRAAVTARQEPFIPETALAGPAKGGMAYAAIPGAPPPPATLARLRLVPWLAARLMAVCQGGDRCGQVRIDKERCG